MSHNSIYKAGPTLKEAEAKGATHVEIQCLHLKCRHRMRIEIGKVPGPRDVPVNHLNWKCQALLRRESGRELPCRSLNVSVSLIFPEGEVVPAVSFDITGLRPLRRRAVRCG